MKTAFGSFEFDTDTLDLTQQASIAEEIAKSVAATVPGSSRGVTIEQEKQEFRRALKVLLIFLLRSDRPLVRAKRPPSRAHDRASFGETSP